MALPLCALSRLTLPVLCLSLAGCGVLREETPRQREERKLSKAMEAPDLLIYRGLKVSLRALPAKVEDSAIGAEADKLRELTKHLFSQLNPRHGEDEAAASSYESLAAADYLGAGRELYEMRSVVRETDEDIYPTLLHTIVGEEGPAKVGMPWYDSTHEHMIFVLTWLAVAQVPRGFRVYEANEIDPAQLEEPGLRLAAHLLRGTTYMHERWPLHCVDELDAYFGVLDSDRESALAWIASRRDHGESDVGGLSEDSLAAVAHAPGSLVRGLCRLRADDKQGSLDDFEAFLADAATLGLDGEVVWMIAAYVGLEREDSDVAMKNLRKLADSDMFGASELRLIADAIKALEDQDGDAAKRSLSEGLAIGKVVSDYVSRELNKHDWRSKLGESEAGRKLLHLIELMATEVDAVKGKLSPDHMKELGNSALEKERELESKVGCGAS